MAIKRPLHGQGVRDIMSHSAALRILKESKRRSENEQQVEGDETMQLIRILLYEGKTSSKEKLQKMKKTHSVASEEQTRLDYFLLRRHNTYDFSAEQFDKLLHLILQRRVLDTEWCRTAFPQHKLRILRVVRVLSRDPGLCNRHLLSKEVIAQITSDFRGYANEYYSLKQKGPSFTSQILVELACLFKRIAADRHQEIFGILRSLVVLLAAKEVELIQAVLATLIAIANAMMSYERLHGPAVDAGDEDEEEEEEPTRTFCREIASYSFIDCVLPLLQSKPCQLLVTELLDVVLEDRGMRKEVQLLGGVSMLLSLLTKEDLALSVVRCLGKLSTKKETAREIRYLNGIPTLLSLLDHKKEDSSYKKTDTKQSEQSEYRVALLTATCATLTQLAMEDEGAVLIRKNDGIYKIGHLILVYFSLEYDALSSDLIELQLYALRSLRFLYSIERNRFIFKRLFPAVLFSAFIDIGHYVHDIQAYTILLQEMYRLPWHAKASMISGFEKIQTIQEQTIIIQDYIVHETLGKGAFGTVYQVSHTTNKSRFYAMKELPLLEDPKMDMQEKVAELTEEVGILSQLEHPNIVKYYTSFVQESNLYLVMEYVDGGSLYDLITSVSEKKQRMSEEEIWGIFVQLVLGLTYLHTTKKIVHRDLTPANIICSLHRDVKITDFGLARQKHSTNSILKSAVGTISYACPEIIMHEKYSDKADVWSLGCILYHMASLKPPFAGNNPLAVAQRIVKGAYPPLEPGLYSPLLYATVEKLLTIDSEERPSIEGVASIIGPIVMQSLAASQRAKRTLIESLQFERDARIKDEDDFQRQRQSWRQQLGRMKTKARVVRSQSLNAGLYEADVKDTDSPPIDTAMDVSPPLEQQAMVPVPRKEAAVTTPQKKHSGFVKKKKKKRQQSAGLLQQRQFSTSAPIKIASQGSTTTPSSSSNSSKKRHSHMTVENNNALRTSSVPPPSFARAFSSPHHMQQPVSVGVDRLQLISNPVEQILTQLHKLVYIDQLPLAGGREVHRRVLMRYKRHLFGQGLVSDDSSNSTNNNDDDNVLLANHDPVGKLKEEMKLLLTQSLDLVSVDFPMLEETSGKTGQRKNKLSMGGSTGYGYRYPSNRITYEQLYGIIETLCKENGYYGGEKTSTVLHENNENSGVVLQVEPKKPHIGRSVASAPVSHSRRRLVSLESSTNAPSDSTNSSTQSNGSSSVKNPFRSLAPASSSTSQKKKLPMLSKKQRGSFSKTVPKKSSLDLMNNEPQPNGGQSEANSVTKKIRPKFTVPKSPRPVKNISPELTATPVNTNSAPVPVMSTAKPMLADPLALKPLMQPRTKITLPFELLAMTSVTTDGNDEKII